MINIMEILNMFSTNDFALILRCIFDRIPIIIGGKDKERVDDLLIKLCDLIPIREEIVFGTDFLEKEEHDAINQEEKINYDNQRILFRAPVNTEPLILKKIDSLKGWIIGLCINGNLDAFFETALRLRKKMALPCLLNSMMQIKRKLSNFIPIIMINLIPVWKKESSRRHFHRLNMLLNESSES